VHRFALDYLAEWKERDNRKPLVIRGARQVGKSYLVHRFGEMHFDNVVVLDFELQPEVAALFDAKDPTKVVPLLELHANARIRPGRTLLFLDEIQAAPGVFAALRYFHELMPSLHVIAAGSLLEFVLDEHSFSMPVGRIEYLHLGPMLFEEFLAAVHETMLVDYLGEFSSRQSIAAPLHQRLMNLLRAFLVVGGMPEAVSCYAESGSFRECEMAKRSILSTYRDDFAKYDRRVNTDRVRKVFDAVPRMVGRKFKYSQVDRGERAKDLGAALRLLTLARVVYLVRHSAGNGVPLGAGSDDRRFKALFLDVGLIASACGLDLLSLKQVEELVLVNSGAIAEQFVGQQLLDSRPHFEEPELYHWTREQRNSSAEVDYVLSEGTTIYPIEVKAGKTGTLKSLHLFLAEKRRDFAVRLNSEPPVLLNAKTALPGMEKKSFRLLSLPLYMAGQVRRLTSEILSGRPHVSGHPGV